MQDIDEQFQRVALTEEVLHLEKMLVETDRVCVQAKVEERTVVGERGVIEVTRSPVEIEVAAAPPPREENGTLNVSVVEEQLVVGKREVDHGSVRVRSYVTETPVHEQVRLRDEKLNVERRPVDRRLSDADDAFRERTIDMTATREQAVVGKTARVVEEVLISKIAGERVEQIDDTVRRTDVEVERDDAARTDGRR